ncbi:hypothetical protein Hanom_Chr06g00521631 [Helianthus anomalus]
MSALQSFGIFQEGAIFRPYDREIRSDMSSTEGLCLNAFPFTLGLRFPFLDFITDFFCITGLSFSQTMMMLWRVLVVLDRIKNAHIPELSVNDLPLAYRLRSHGSSRFMFYSTSNDPLILRATRNEEEWKSKFFFVKRSSIPGGADPVKWLRRVGFRKLTPPLTDSEKSIKAIRLLPKPERSFILYLASSSQHSNSNMSHASKMPILLDREELDSYPTPIQVKKETSDPTSSKPNAVPKPNLRTRASTSKKRKGSETLAPASKGFSYEDLSFIDSLEPMTSFLDKVISWLYILHLHAECVS